MWINLAVDVGNRTKDLDASLEGESLKLNGQSSRVRRWTHWPNRIIKWWKRGSGVCKHHGQKTSKDIRECPDSTNPFHVTTLPNTCAETGTPPIVENRFPDHLGEVGLGLKGMANGMGTSDQPRVGPVSTNSTSGGSNMLTVDLLDEKVLNHLREGWCYSKRGYKPWKVKFYINDSSSCFPVTFYVASCHLVLKLLGCVRQLRGGGQGPSEG